MKKGIVDIGSNTVKLKVFKNDLEILAHSFPVQIGIGLINNSLTEDKIIEIFNCFKEIHELSKKEGFSIAQIIGTSALRDAENSFIVQDRIKAIFNQPLRIIDGEEEANLIYRGVRKGIESSKNYLICDIGGGSVELIYCNNKELIKAQSFEIGVIKMLKVRENQDPISPEDLTFFISFLSEQLHSFLSGCSTKHLVGAAGSFETMFTLVHQKPYHGEFTEIELEKLQDALLEILISTQLQRDENELIPIERKILLPFGAIIVNYLLNKLEINKFTVSPNSLIEGLI